MRKLCGKKYTFAAIAMLLIAAVSFALIPSASLRAYAENPPIEAKVVMHGDTACTYRYFENLTAIYALDEGFALADGADLLYFDSNGKEITNDSTPHTVPENTEKLYIGESGIITLSGGILTVFGNEIEDFAVIDFTVHGSFLYAAIENSDELYRLELNSGEGEEEPKATSPTLSPAPNFSPMGIIKRVSSDKDKVYFTVSSGGMMRNYDDVYSYDAESAPQLYVKYSPEVSDMSGTVRLTSEGIFVSKENKPISSAYADAKKISEAGGNVYAMTKMGGVFVLGDDFTRTDILASAHKEEKGFFFANAGISSRIGGIAVADEFNNRVQILSNSGVQILYGDCEHPTAVTSDNSDTFFVSHSANKICVVKGEEVSEISSTDRTAITDIKADIDGNLFVLHESGKLYLVTYDGGFVFSEWFDDAEAIELSPNNDALFVLKFSGDMLKISYGESGHRDEKVTNGITGAADFCVDHDENLYVLTAAGDILKYAKSSGYLSPEQFTVKGLIKGTKIVMNVTESAALNISRGDLLISDTGAHAVKYVSGAELGVKATYDAEVENPIDGELGGYDDDSEFESIKSKAVIFTVKGCDVYEDAKRTTPTGHRLKDGMRVIIPNYDFGNDDKSKCVFIIADNLSDKSGEAICGYVPYSAIKTEKNVDGTETTIPKHLPAPPMTYCYPLVAMTVYEYPTVHCATATKVSKDTKLTLLDFPYRQGGKAYGYEDNFSSPNVWYRVWYKEGEKYYEGYITSELTYLGNTSPDERNIYPRTNATIISKDKNNSKLRATLYQKNSKGEFEPVPNETGIEALPVGKKVEVVGKFDSSSKYTLIKYYLNDSGTVIHYFYVETANLKYDGTNVVTVVATVVIMLTVILAIILLLRFTKHNNKNKKN